MGDPHYNTWGGKNNSWGNKNRKDTSSNDNRQEPNKLGRAFFGGMLLFLCASMGLSVVNSIYDAITGAKDKVETVREVKEYITGDKVTSQGGRDFNLVDEIDISADDVKEILDYLDGLIDREYPVGDNIVTVDYSSVDNVKKYEKNIIKKLNNYNKDVTFITIYDEYIESNDKATEEINRVKQLVADNVDYLNDTELNSLNQYEYERLHYNRPRTMR